MRASPCFYGWTVVVASLLLFLASIIGHTTGMSMAVPFFMAEFGLTRSQMSFMWMVAMFVSAMLLPLAGALVDWGGSRLVVKLVILPYVGVVTSLGLVQNVYQLAAAVVALRFLGPEVLTLVAQVTPNK